MKKLLYLACMVGLIGATSCKKDAEGPVNQATIDGKAYTIKKGLAVDYGAYGTTHYNYDYYLTDDANLTTGSEQVNGTILIYMELFSSGATEFRTGTFSYNSSTDIEGQNFFRFADVLVDANNDNILDDTDTYMEAIGGTVTVSGTNPNFTVAYDLSFPNNKKLVGSYTGAHQYIDRSGSSFPGTGERVSKKRLF